jgi:RimJ/RimL family protein N-acetyltransferase
MAPSPAVTTPDASARRFRRGGPDDLDAVLRLFDDAVAWLNARGETRQWGSEPWSQRPEAIARVRDLLADETWIAERPADRAVLGVLVLGDAPEYAPPPTVPERYVLLLLTAREPAARGAGGELLTLAADRAREAGAERLRVDCFSGTEHLTRYYESQGFAKDGTFDVAGWPGQVLSRAVQP